MNGIQENQKLESAPNANPPIGIEKRCTRCGNIKLLSEFYRQKDGKYGVCSICKKCIKKRANEWRLAHLERARERTKEWCLLHPENVRAKNKRERTTPKGKLNHAISNGIRKSLHVGKGGRHWEDLIGYTVEQLKRHLEKQFSPGMTWDKYLKGEIHVDHISPISAFNFETSDNIDFKRCWALKNLRPLWARENISKGAKLNKPFQPAFLF